MFFIVNRGYYPKGGGEVVLKVNPVKELSPINLTERGNITKIYWQGLRGWSAAL